jgi:hypothetical protein
MVEQNPEVIRDVPSQQWLVAQRHDDRPDGRQRADPNVTQEGWQENLGIIRQRPGQVSDRGEGRVKPVFGDDLTAVKSLYRRASQS